MNMITRSYTVRFLTPAFLGDAEQNGAWRTPPFKALLRQWWRVAVAANCGFNVDTLREREAALFGSAADGKGTRSLIRLRLGRWDEGKLKGWDRLEQRVVHHPEVQRTQYKIGPHAYLGYGPLDGRGGTKFSKATAAIQYDEKAEFKLAWPESAREIELASLSAISTALWLMDRYGTLGGRSRNGWGSFALTPTDDTPVLSGPLQAGLVQDWTAALNLDWPHAIGTDGEGKPLIWDTGPQTDWKTAMKRLAEIKIGLRTQFKFISGRNAAQAEERHWLSYPVTNHNVAAWREGGKGDFRLPNSLRFKVRHGADGKLRGVIFHVPCKPPQQFSPDLNVIKGVWQKVHTYLDAPAQELSRIPE